MVMRIALTSFGRTYAGAIILYFLFAFWAALSLSIMVRLELNYTLLFFKN